MSDAQNRTLAAARMSLQMAGKKLGAIANARRFNREAAKQAADDLEQRAREFVAAEKAVQ